MLLGWLYTTLLPETDAQLSALEQLHAAGPPAERAGIEQFARQWVVVRDLLSPTSVAGLPAATLASRLAAAYLPLGAHLDLLFQIEQRDGQVDQVDASANGARTTWLVIAVALAGIALGVALLVIVGGEVIGSALLTRPAPYDQADEQRIRESVGQAAPVLANLRNLAIAELRAATDGLTGLPNKRAVTDTLKRMFAEASTKTSPLVLLLLDLDHFQQVNERNSRSCSPAPRSTRRCPSPSASVTRWPRSPSPAPTCR
jgi:GGDEF domain-containing protein